MGIQERKERQKSELRERIIETATEMFMKDGFEETSIRKIASQIEYSPATLYLYFKDKNEIFEKIQEMALEKFVTKLKEFDFIKDPIGRIKSFSHSYLDFAITNKELYTLMFGDQPATVSLNKTDWLPGKKSFEMIKQLIKSCNEKNQLKKMNPDETTLLVWSYLHGMSTLAIHQRLVITNDKLLTKEYIKNTTERLFEIISASYF